MTPMSALDRWLPINIIFSRNMVAVRWMEFGSTPVSDPFFHQTVKKLRAKEPPAPELTTNLATLIEKANTFPPRKPAGLIFHVSRCGSTLVANALRTGAGVVVLSEAQPTGTLFRANAFRDSPFPVEGWDQARKMLLDCLATIYSNYAEGAEPKLVIKCHAASILQLKLIRAVWPDVPFVIVIRDPIEVMMSNMAKPGGWVRCRKRPLLTRQTFGWTGLNVKEMPLDEYCARGIGTFCESASGLVGDDCKVIDYGRLDAANLHKIADFFGIKIHDSGNFRRTISTYSKDPQGTREFTDDRKRKQSEALESVRASAQRWAQKPYEALKRLEAW
jgi:hypothetical protein